MVQQNRGAQPRPCLRSAVYQHQGMLNATSRADETPLWNYILSLVSRVHNCLSLAFDNYGNGPITFTRLCRSRNDSRACLGLMDHPTRCFLSSNLSQGSPWTSILRVARRGPGVFKPRDGLHTVPFPARSKTDPERGMTQTPVMQSVASSATGFSVTSFSLRHPSRIDSTIYQPSSCRRY